MNEHTYTYTYTYRYERLGENDGVDDALHSTLYDKATSHMLLSFKRHP